MRDALQWVSDNELSLVNHSKSRSHVPRPALAARGAKNTGASVMHATQPTSRPDGIWRTHSDAGVSQKTEASKKPSDPSQAPHLAREMRALTNVQGPGHAWDPRGLLPPVLPFWPFSPGTKERRRRRLFASRKKVRIYAVQGPPLFLVLFHATRAGEHLDSLSGVWQVSS